MREILKWQDIKNYEGIYQVSNRGDVRRLSTPPFQGTGRYARKLKLKALRANNKGYLMVDLWKDGTREQFLVHRLVAQAFLPNHKNYPVVNHIDENKINNCVENLEWCTQKHNMNHGSFPRRISVANGKPVKQLDKKTKRLLKIFSSAMDAERKTGIGNSRISECCTGARKSAGGFIWTREGLL